MGSVRSRPSQHRNIWKCSVAALQETRRHSSSQAVQTGQEGAATTTASSKRVRPSCFGLGRHTALPRALPPARIVQTRQDQVQSLRSDLPRVQTCRGVRGGEGEGCCQIPVRPFCSSCFLCSSHRASRCSDLFSAAYQRAETPAVNHRPTRHVSSSGSDVSPHVAAADY